MKRSAPEVHRFSLAGTGSAHFWVCLWQTRQCVSDDPVHGGSRVAIYSFHVGRVGRSTHAPGTASAHARYILCRKTVGVVLAEHMPDGFRAVQQWLLDQEEADRKNARVIEKIMVAFPLELHPLQRQQLLREFCGRITRGRAPWLAAIHDKGKDAHNPHAHIIIRDRDIETRRRVAQLSEKGSCDWLRKLWADTANEALERAGQKVRIDHRSLKDQEVERIPTRHCGPSSALRL